MSTMWVVTIDLGYSSALVGRTLGVCGVFDTRVDAELYVAERAEYAGREPDEYTVTEVDYYPDPKDGS